MTIGMKILVLVPLVLLYALTIMCEILPSSKVGDG